MSRMGNLIFDITERYESGQDAHTIAKATKTDESFVRGVIEESNVDTDPTPVPPAIVDDGIPF